MSTLFLSLLVCFSLNYVGDGADFLIPGSSFYLPTLLFIMKIFFLQLK